MPRVPQRITAALIGTVLAVGLPTGLALAASANARHGVEVSAVARTHIAGLSHGTAVSSVARTRAACPTPATPKVKDQGTTATHPANHGATVSAIAKDHSLVGGAHGNHGGAVAPVAHKH